MKQPAPKSSAKKRAGGLRLKRVYEPADASDGLRVLVDRLWPRGLSKEKARIDVWAKDVAPSDMLRRRFHAKPEKWSEFVAAYRRELDKEPAKTATAELRRQLRRGPATLLYAARDEEHNNAVALKELLRLRGALTANAAKPPHKT